MTASKVNVGFVGLGIMGLPMATHIYAAGYPLRVFSRTRSKAQSLLSRGTEWRESAADVAADCDVFITCVTDTPEVEALLFGPRGAAESLPSGAIVVDMSTIRPDAACEFAQRLAERGVAMLDAPVTGGEVGARNATLTIMVGGDPAAFQRVLPLLQTMGKKVAHVGPSGAGQSLKACNQILCAVNMIGVCEALQLARAAGLDLHQAIDTLAAGAGGSWAWSTLGAKIVAGDLKPAFMIRLIQKDLRIVQDAADASHLPMPGTALAQQLFRAVEASAGGAELGTQAMIRAYECLIGRDA
ncbi:MAG: NAD(P)-dependent oxidoreductase [Phycisphaerae bacterium]